MLKERNENAEMAEVRGKISSVLPFEFRFPYSCSLPNELKEMAAWNFYACPADSPTTFGPVWTILQQKPELEGLTFSLTESPYVVVEIADCLSNSGEMTEEASWLMSIFDSYTAFTIDGTGMQIIIKAELPKGQWQYENITIYSGTGQFNFSAIILPGTPYKIEKQQKQLDHLLAKYPFVNIWQKEGRIVVSGANNTSYDSPISGEAQMGHHAPVSEANDTSNDTPVSDLNDMSDHAPVSDLNDTSDYAPVISDANNTPDRAPLISDANDTSDHRPINKEALPADERDIPATEAEQSEEEKAIDKVFQLAVSYLNWVKLAGRTRTADFHTFLVVLQLMHDANNSTIHLSSRQLAYRAGVTTRTATKILRRLQQYGLITLLGKSEQGRKVYIYQLVPIGEIKQKLASTLLETPNKPINTNVLINYAGHDAFLYGAKLLIEGHFTLGPTALAVLSAIIAQAEEQAASASDENNGLNFSEIARRTGLSASTVSKKAKALAKLGLVTITKEGRSQIVRLISLTNWQEQLERNRHLLSTNGKAEARLANTRQANARQANARQTNARQTNARQANARQTNARKEQPPKQMPALH